LTDEYHRDLSHSEIERIVEKAEEIAAKGRQDGIRIVEYKDDGVYLTVLPPQNGGRPLNPEEVVRDIEARKIHSVDTAKVRQVVREMKGEPAIIAPPQKEIIEDAVVNVELSKDKMEAYLTIYPPRGGKPATRKDVEEAIKEKNVVYGVADEVIDKAVALQHISEPLVVARGSQPVHGENARIDFKFNKEGIAGKPTELVDGRVDFYSLNLINNVEPGDILAVKIPATMGTPGYLVTGEEVPPKPGKDVQIGIGKNVELIDNGTTALSTARGHVVYSAGKISVSTVYEVAGDVDFNTGNIEFKGSVIVKGSIREGFKVIADGDVEVLNTIADGVVECSGNLKVRNGIVGKKSNIKAGGSVFTRFIENSKVESGGDVVVGEAIMHSRVSARRSVTVGGKGVIVGGLVRAGEEISCRIAGSPLATVTELEAGINPEVRKEHTRLLREKQEKEMDFDKADKAIKLLTHLQRAQGELPADKMAILVRVSRAQNQLVTELEEIKQQLENVEYQIQQSERGHIKVQGIMHPGVKVTIGSAYLHIQDQCTFVSLTKSGEDIKISPYS